MILSMVIWRESERKKMDYDNLVMLFHKKRHEDKGFNAFYRSHDFTLWVCDLIKDGTLVVTKKENVVL